MSTKWMRILRQVSVIEGVSFLLLLGVAMPMKYGAGMDWAVSYVGWAHGLLFMLLWLLVALTWAMGLPAKLAGWVLLGSVLPVVPFVVDRWLKAYEQTVEADAAPRPDPGG